MDLSLSIPFYNYNSVTSLRYEITRKCFNHYSKIQKNLKDQGINLLLNFVGSEGKKSYNLVKPFLKDMSEYTEYVQSENITPHELREKYNECFLSAKRHFGEHLKYSCICGSNDFVHEGVFNYINENNQYNLIGIDANASGNNLILVDYQNKKIACGSGKYPFIYNNNLIGGFYALDKTLLEDLNYRPFQFEHDEIGMELYCQRKNFAIHGIDSKIINVKSDRDINTYEDCLYLKTTDLDAATEKKIFDYIDDL